MNKLFILFTSIFLSLFLPTSLYAQEKQDTWSVWSGAETVKPNIKYKYTLYENKTLERLKESLLSVKNFYFTLQGKIFSTEDRVDIKTDINYPKMKKNFEREISFLKWLKKEKWLELTQEEKEAFFFALHKNKTTGFIKKGEWEVFEDTLTIETDGKKENFKISIDTQKGKIIAQKDKEGRLVNVYSGKIEIPKNTKIYKIGSLTNKENGHLYIVVWFFSDTGLWTNILSITGWTNNISLISNVTGLVINNNPKYNFETINCYPDFSYLHLTENTLKLFCLDKKDHNNIRERNIIN